MVEMPSLRQLLESGVHFGHKKSRWHPKMAEFIFTSKDSVHIINLEKTVEKLEEAAKFVEKEAALGKIFVFVGTKKQSSPVIEEVAKSCSMPYVNVRWLGGTLTNFESVKAAIARYIKQKEELVEAEKNGLAKSEISKLKKQISRSDKFFGGLGALDRKPDVLLLFGSYDEKNALHEATTQGLKTVAIVDTNADPSLVDYPIPANDDATKSVKIIADVLANSITSGRAKAESAK